MSRVDELDQMMRRGFADTPFGDIPHDWIKYPIVMQSWSESMKCNRAMSRPKCPPKPKGRPRGARSLAKLTRSERVSRMAAQMKERLSA